MTLTALTIAALFGFAYWTQSHAWTEQRATLAPAVQTLLTIALTALVGAVWCILAAMIAAGI